MSKQVLIYERAVPLSRQTHRDWSLRTGSDFSFAREVNAVPLTAVEILSAAYEYPIVFAGREGGVMPLAVLGPRPGTNVFVSPEGGWTGRYIPAFVRRYPFIFATSEGEEATVTLCIDESFGGWSREGRGERLFDADGEQTHYLRQVVGFLRDYETHLARTRAFCARLRELDLLAPIVDRAAGCGRRTVHLRHALVPAALLFPGSPALALDLVQTWRLRGTTTGNHRPARRRPRADRPAHRYRRGYPLQSPPRLPLSPFTLRASTPSPWPGSGSPGVRRSRGAPPGRGGRRARR